MTLSPKIKYAGGIGAVCLSLICGIVYKFEGTEQVGYLDPVAIPTICRGHTGPEVKVGDYYTMEKCDEITKQDIIIANTDLHKLTDTKMSPGQEAAFTSFIYNTGSNNFRNSTMRKKLNAGDVIGACHELSKWIYAKGQLLRGLVRRRAEELSICLG